MDTKTKIEKILALPCVKIDSYGGTASINFHSSYRFDLDVLENCNNPVEVFSLLHEQMLLGILKKFEEKQQLLQKINRGEI